ncbi:MAG: hypothetical protein HWE39_12285, partial [Oceanospirillaceae bacterium]|nr:hypothetical protein [Oceanospirillaceae bacterium]
RADEALQLARELDIPYVTTYGLVLVAAVTWIPESADLFGASRPSTERLVEAERSGQDGSLLAYVHGFSFVCITNN